MNQPTKRTVLRTTAIVLHTLANFIVIAYLLSFDISSSWLAFAFFVIACSVLIALLAFHAVSFIRFLQLN